MGGGADSVVEAALTEHNSSLDAHPDIREALNGSDTGLRMEMIEFQFPTSATSETTAYQLSFQNPPKILMFFYSNGPLVVISGGTSAGEQAVHMFYPDGFIDTTRFYVGTSVYNYSFYIKKLEDKKTFLIYTSGSRFKGQKVAISLY